MKFVNLTETPYTFRGETLDPSGVVCRLERQYTPFDTDGVCTVVCGEVENLPAPAPDTLYIVAGHVAVSGYVKGRADVVSPATGHPAAVGQPDGSIDVPGFVRAR